MTKDAYRGPLERVNEYLWRIPKSYKPGMRVDGLIYADERLIEKIRSDQALDQVANVAMLPGIQHASLAMPDIHWGYGFCIGGVAATGPDSDGVISPGGVGFDINCLCDNTLVINNLGCFRPIAASGSEWPDSELACFRLTRPAPKSATVQLWFARKPETQVLELTTEANDTISATADHPFWTPTGMVRVGSLDAGDRVAIAPFEGVPYQAPSDDILVSEADIEKKLFEIGKGKAGNALGQILAFLKDRALVPLRYSSPALPYLCKVVGFVMGDGSIHVESARNKAIVSFWGEPADLESIRRDTARLGLTASQIYRRNRHHRIDTAYGTFEFDHEEAYCRVGSTGVAALLACLGAPIGNKARQDYAAPAWLDAAPLWQKRLFLASLFGAELSKPKTIPGHDTVFGQPMLSMNKAEEFVSSGRQFLAKISQWLEEFGVKTQGIQPRKEYVNASGIVSIRLRLVLSPDIDSLVHLWGRVGYEYNRKRAGLAALAVQYLKLKRAYLERRQAMASAMLEFAGLGLEQRRIVRQFAGSRPDMGYLARVLDLGRVSIDRVGRDFPTFEQYCKEASDGLGLSGMVWERIATVRPIDYDGLVYDLTVDHADHNFIANGFVVSNCGVRLVRTKLSQPEVQPQLTKLVDRLFENIPAGVGRSGKYRFGRNELRDLMAEGPRYLQKRGHATEGDIDHTEARGQLAGARPDEVSDRALERGAGQCGTLGSGNHFLEVQVVDEIHDEEAARVIGIAKGQVCVMIHSGSRGLGYQVCDDALAMLRRVSEKYRISLPDPQLACAPVSSAEGEKYIGAMRAAANFAWCNRQLLMWQAREVFEAVLGRPWTELGMTLVYDVAHNIAKLEEHVIDGRPRRVWVHRKGATRAFPPGHPEVPAQYRGIGQPVIIPGDMGRASWLLVGQPAAMEQTFGTTCHGAGRAMSRTAALRDARGRRVDRELAEQGIVARARSLKGLAEEQPAAYKDVAQVVEVVHRAGLSKKVARLRPIGVIKG